MFDLHLRELITPREYSLYLSCLISDSPSKKVVLLQEFQPHEFKVGNIFTPELWSFTPVELDTVQMTIRGRFFSCSNDYLKLQPNGLVKENELFSSPFMPRIVPSWNKDLLAGINVYQAIYDYQSIPFYEPKFWGDRVFCKLNQGINTKEYQQDWSDITEKYPNHYSFTSKQDTIYIFFTGEKFTHTWSPQTTKRPLRRAQRSFCINP